MIPSAPGITVINKTVLLRDGGILTIVERMEETGVEKSAGQEVAEVNYELEVRAVNDRVAERKARGFALVRHPSDMLDIEVSVAKPEGRTEPQGLFSDAGPREPYIASVVIEKPE